MVYNWLIDFSSYSLYKLFCHYNSQMPTQPICHLVCYIAWRRLTAMSRKMWMSWALKLAIPFVSLSTMIPRIRYASLVPSKLLCTHTHIHSIVVVSHTRTLKSYACASYSPRPLSGTGYYFLSLLIVVFYFQFTGRGLANGSKGGH